MRIIKAGNTDLEAIKQITVQTIRSVYPHYYPQGAVEFFLQHHSDQNIKNDIHNGNVYLCLDDDNKALGTVTIKEKEICRLFVLPEYQGNGYGRALLEFAEKKIAENYSQIILDASLPAKAIYLKRGYTAAAFHSIKTENGDYLCYDDMVKKME